MGLFIIIIIVVVICFLFKPSNNDKMIAKKFYDFDHDINGEELSSFDSQVKKLAIKTKFPEVQRELKKCINDDGTVDREAAAECLANYIVWLRAKEIGFPDVVSFGVTADMLKKQEDKLFKQAELNLGAGLGGAFAMAYLLQELSTIVYCDIYGNKLSDDVRRAKTIARYSDDEIKVELQKCIQEDGTMDPIYIDILTAID